MKKIIIGTSIVAAAAFLFLAVYFFKIKAANNNLQLDMVACTMEAKICPDGSAVGRSGPKCEFAECPTASCPGDTCPIDDSPTVSPEPNSGAKNCTAEQRKGDVCAEIYAPVCATVQIQCIKAPCEPIQQTFSNECEACHNKLVASYVAGECQTTEKSAAAALQTLFIAKYPKYAKTLTVRVDQETATHARGGIGFETGAPGGIFLATKINEQWQIVFDGNGNIPCNLSKYDFPAKMLKDCN